MGELTGKTALVTGAGGRIGRAIATTLAGHGARVIASDVDPGTLSETAASLGGGGHSTVTADLSSVAEVERLVGVAVEDGLDVLVNNAAILDPGGRITDCPDDLYERVMAVNVRAPFFAIRAAIPHMLERGGGAIVNVASVLSTTALPGFSAYCVSKGAVAQLTRSVAVDYAKDGIRCNAVCPGTIARPGEVLDTDELDELVREFTKLHPMGRTGLPDEIGEVVAFLASDRASFMTGALVHADGGFTAW